MKLNHATARLIAKSDLFEEWYTSRGWEWFSEYRLAKRYPQGWELADEAGLLERFLDRWDAEMVAAVELGQACGMSVRDVWDLYQVEAEAFEIIKGRCQLVAA